MTRDYPVLSATSAPATGRQVYEHLMRNARIPAVFSHKIWYAGEEAKLEQPEKYAFRGNTPKGRTMLLVSLSGKPIRPGRQNTQKEGSSSLYTFAGDEGPVFVSDLSERARLELGIPKNAKADEKVFNPNFKPYDELDRHTRTSNELTALSLPKSVSSYFGSRNKINYSEKDVLRMLIAAVKNLSSPEMMHILYGNNTAWTVLEYVRSNGNIEGDIVNEFHGQQSLGFYMKDVGTVLPGMFYAMALLGRNPLEIYRKIDALIPGAETAAEYMRQFMKEKPSAHA